jgi:hypothetical protein
MVPETRQRFFDLCHFLAVEACNQNIAAAMLQGAHDGYDFLGFLALPEDHLGKTLTHRPMVVNLRKTKIFKWPLAQASHCFDDGEFSAPHILQQFGQAFGIHVIYQLQTSSRDSHISLTEVVMTAGPRMYSSAVAVQNRNTFSCRHAGADSGYRHAGTFGEFCDRSARAAPGAKKQLVIFAASQSPATFTTARERTIGTGTRQILFPYDRADIAFFAKMSQVLKQAIANIDHRNRHFIARQQNSGAAACGGPMMPFE